MQKRLQGNIGTANLVERFSKEEDMTTKSNPIKLVRRQEKRGLSSAILDGFSFASGDIAVVMNADFSHPPELIPEMIRQLTDNKEVDLVMASRYIEGGRIEGVGLKRRLMSIAATKIAQYALDIKKSKILYLDSLRLDASRLGISNLML
jgi:dolichol-phosphate mannosyltransferase